MIIAQGGLGLMDASTRAIPDFVLTMSQAIRHAEEGFSFGSHTTPYRLPPTLTNLFNGTLNPTSIFLKHFFRLLPDIARVGAPQQCPDPIDYFVKNGSFKSARDRLKQEASRLRHSSLLTIARPDLQKVLSEILIASSSYPIIGMCRSNPQNRRAPDLFIINLKMKLHLELYDPKLCPKCLCGKTIDVFGMHTFCCVRVSKKVCHDRVVFTTAPFIRDILLTAGIIAKGSVMYIEPKNIVADLPGLRPFDSSFRPVPSLKRTTIPPIPFTEVGFDYTITSPKGHLSPSKINAASIKRSATAAAHLIEKEKKKLARDGHCDPYNHTSFTGEQINHDMLQTNRVLIPVAISPYGRWGPMFHKFLFGTMSDEPIKFFKTRPKAQQMYDRATSYPSPIGIVPLATSNWKAEKARTQHFYGHSYTAPTPKEFILQKLGLCISNCIALHIRDAKLGSLVPPTHPHDEDFTPPPPGDCVGVDSHLSSIPPSLRSDFSDAASWWSPHATPPQVSYFPADPALVTTHTTNLTNIGVA
jgi:hypothetical protein